MKTKWKERPILAKDYGWTGKLALDPDYKRFSKCYGVSCLILMRLNHKDRDNESMRVELAIILKREFKENQ